MLDIIGQDRKMTRLQGEPVEAWRKRLQMKAIIAELAGSEKGILLALESVGYNYAYIDPLWKVDPERWAEINVVFQKDIDEEEYIDFQSIKQAVMETKQASTFPHFIFHYTTGIQIMETCQGELPVYPSVLDRYPAAGWFLAAGWGRLLKCRVGKFTLPDKTPNRFPHPGTAGRRNYHRIP